MKSSVSLQRSTEIVVFRSGLYYLKKLGKQGHKHQPARVVLKTYFSFKQVSNFPRKLKRKSKTSAVHAIFKKATDDAITNLVFTIVQGLVMT